MKWRSLARTGLVSTLAQLAGRIVNFILPILLLTKFGVSAETDAFFIVLAAAFYVSGSLANSATDALIPYIVAHKAITKTKLWLLVSNLIGFLTILICLFFLPETSLRLLLSIVIGGLLIAISGFYSSRLVAFCYANNDYVNPGISWLYRVFALLPLLSIQNVNESVAYCMLALGAGDLMRLYHLNLIVKKLGSQEVKNLSPPPSFRYYLSTMLGPVTLGINPIVDRFIASTLGTGQVSMLEMSERLWGLFTMVLTVGLLQVLHVEFSKSITTQPPNFNHSKLLGGIFFSVLFLALLVIIFLEFFKPLLKSNIQQLDLPTVLDYVNILILSTPAMITGMVCARILIALKNPFDVMIIAIFAMLFNIILSMGLAIYFELTGVILATLIVYSITALLLMNQVKLRVS